MLRVYISMVILLCIVIATSVVLILHFTAGKYSISPTDIVGEVFSTAFDFQGDIFVLADLDSDSAKLHKLTSGNELLWTIPLPKQYVWGEPKMLATSQNDLYLRYESSDKVTLLYVVESGFTNLTEIEQIYSSESCQLFILDSSDNLFYCGEKGIKIVRPKSKSSTIIKNLENRIVHREQSATVDNEGNVYLAIAKIGEWPIDEALALITKNEIENQVPKAQLIDYVPRDEKASLRSHITGLIVDDENTLWVFISFSPWDTHAYVRKLKNQVLETVYEEVEHEMVQGLLVKDRFYMIAREDLSLSKGTSIFYITEKNDTVEIAALKNITEYNIQALANKDGDVYFATPNHIISPKLGTFVVVKAGQTEPIAISNFDGKESLDEIERMRMDIDDNLWILSIDTVFVLEKKDDIIRTVGDYYVGCSDVSFNPVTNTVYILCPQGLFYVEK